METNVESRRVLIVDDEPNVTLVLANSLSKLNRDYIVETTNSGTEALQMLQEHRYALVITDYKMPEINGLDIALAIRKLSPGTQVVLMTAYGTEDLHEILGRVKLDGYLDKPFTLAQVRAIVEQAVGRASQQVTAPPGQISIDDEIYRQLELLQSETGARCVMLLTSGGYPIEVVGAHDALDITSVGALVAANFMAAVELSRLLGNDSIFKSSYHEGPDYNIYSYDVNGEMLLGVIFGLESRPGAVWFYTKQVAASLADFHPPEVSDIALPEDLSSGIDRELAFLFDQGDEGTTENDGGQAEEAGLLDLQEAIAAGLIPANLAGGGRENN
ncbi:MAG: response regulator [Anaerolineales bacterium]